MNTKTVIVITGPTASGKTPLAIEAALHYNTEIISADSRQCFREMNIGVAKPSAEELSTVRHHFINSHSIHDEVNAATFAEYANDVAEELFRDKDVVIMAGGTGLYIKAFVEGLDDVPDVDGSIREQVISNYKANGIEWLQHEIMMHDPKFFSEGEIKNPQRLMRALEVVLATGQSIKDFHRKAVNGALSKYNIVKYAIDLPRDQLYKNINKRVDKMMEQGLIDEVMSLQQYKHLNALQTVGYSELFEYFAGNMTLQQAVEKIKQNTRNYAKRQMTWLRKETQLKWIKSLSAIIQKT